MTTPAIVTPTLINTVKIVTDLTAYTEKALTGVLSPVTPTLRSSVQTLVAGRLTSLT